MTSRTPPAWQRWADTVLQSEALAWRAGGGVEPRDLAGWYVTGDDVDAILSGLPGLDGAGVTETERIRRSVRPDLDRAAEQLLVELEGDDRFACLVRAAALSGGPVGTLALLAAVELSPGRQRLVAYLNDDVRLPRPTPALLARIGDPATVAPDSPLVRLGLITVEQPGPWATAQLGVPARVVWHLAGNDAPDPALPQGARRRAGTVDADPGSVAEPGGGVLLLYGADRETRLQAAATTTGKELLVVPAPLDRAETLALAREAAITGAAIVAEVTSLESHLATRIEETPELSWVIATRTELPVEQLPEVAWREVRVPERTAAAAEWTAATGAPAPPGYRLDPEQLRRASAARRGGHATLAGAVRRLAAGHLDSLATRVTPRRNWDDLVLPDDEAAQLGELVSRYRTRGRVYDAWGFPPGGSTGIVALFAGPSGTGKTLAAEVIAGDLGLDLYKIDLATVVSKYIGETEKNLGRIFDAAAVGDLVLFFDEADALFGKRSEVSDARDRYANLEVAYLLQRLEAYDGFVVLATNLSRNMDAAFTRRITMTVEFPAPEEPERRRIWSRAIPPTAPQRALDFDFLARNFTITGGMIRGASLGAAFLAASDGGVITMEHVALALKREFQKAGRLRSESEFERYYTLVSGDAPARQVNGSRGSRAAAAG